MPDQNPNNVEWALFPVTLDAPPEAPTTPLTGPTVNDLTTRLGEVSDLGYMVLTVVSSPLWSGMRGGWIVAFKPAS
ncbi:hypothetical protein LCGC14_0520950 [marine sediment metagenome]|uniref:Uncharacterized protein n=1 Tax=marine sediment metagenome TaxID=412755 RepID=A0A0F9SGV3_9ZZZZ|nr:hypothetical protein [Phycisphaerae bacterium]